MDKIYELLAFLTFFLVLALTQGGCTKRRIFEHQYHVASIRINGAETKTSFLLTTKENDNGKCN